MNATRRCGDAAAAVPEPDVCAVVVSYRPDLALLREVLTSVVGQVGELLLFDNATPDPAFEAFASDAHALGVSLVRSKRNVGLGAAMNHAAVHARQAGFSYLLLLDQDSRADAHMVATLKTALEELQRTQRVAAVGPQFQDRRNGHVAPFVRVGFPFSHKVAGGPGERIECDFLISSGTLLSLPALDIIGLMDEGLFIDNVDLEWCFRARYSGYRLFGICDARMSHSIGDTLHPSHWRRGGFIVHKPLRLYYIMRNRLLLYRRKETPWVWIAQDMPRVVVKFVLTALFLKPRVSYLRQMTRGLLDGLRGRMGPAPENSRPS